MFILLLTSVAVVAGAVAAIAGFGIGSLITPVLAMRIDMKLAVAAVALPHFMGTAVRFWALRGHVDRHVLVRFGVASAVGGLAGAVLHAWAGGRVLSAVFGVLLAFAGIAGVTGWAQRMRFRGGVAVGAGLVSSVLGGLVGNQGGIRSAALLGFGLSRDAFVATATAIALIVDVARVPIYLWSEGQRLLALAPLLGWVTAGVVLGTLGGRRVLARIPEKVFRRIVGGIVLLLGLYMFWRALAG
jgi:uncharacterized protein